METRKILKTCAVLLICSAAMLQAVELYAYYSFDDSSQLAKDYSGNGLDLTNDTTYVLTGYTANGAVKGSAVLDGVEQGFQGAGTLYRPGSFTMSLWVKPAISGAQQIIRSSNSGNGYLLKADSDYRIYIYSSDSYSTLRSFTAPAADEWAHILVRFDSDDVADINGDYTGNAQIFINGELKNTLTSIKYSPDGAGYLCLGRRASDLFNGQIDEFAVFSGALTDDEIGYLSNKTTTPLNVVGYKSADIAQLYAYYSFDDNGNIPNDDSESGFDLINNTTYNLPSYTADGAVNGAAVLDGSTQGFLADETLFRPGSYTASIWVKPATTAGQLIIQSSNSGKGYLLKADSDYRAYIYYTGGNTNVRSNFAPVPDEWTHIVVRFISDGQADVNGDYTGDAQIFINGEPKNVYAGIKSHPDGAGYLCLGKRASASFNGQLDEFAVWDSALEDWQIESLAAKEYTPIDLPNSQIVVSSLVATETERVGQSLFRYSVRAKVINIGDTITNAQMVVDHLPANVSLISVNNQFTTGSLNNSEEKICTEIITFEIDRSVLTDENQMSWIASIESPINGESIEIASSEMVIATFDQDGLGYSELTEIAHTWLSEGIADVNNDSVINYEDMAIVGSVSR